MLLEFGIVEFSANNQSVECTKIIMKCILSKCKLSQQIAQTTHEFATTLTNTNICEGIEPLT
jgi:hypothetical protein